MAETSNSPTPSDPAPRSPAPTSPAPSFRSSLKRRAVSAGNAAVVGLQRLGVAFGPMQVLTVVGRRTGRPRTVPVAVVAVGGSRYLVQAFPRAAWVANARAAGTAVLARGRRSAPVRLVELPVADRAPVLRVLADSASSVGRRFAANGLADSAATHDVVAAAPRIAVFRIDEMAPGGIGPDGIGPGEMGPGGIGPGPDRGAAGPGPVPA